MSTSSKKCTPGYQCHHWVTYLASSKISTTCNQVSKTEILSLKEAEERESSCNTAGEFLMMTNVWWTSSMRAARPWSPQLGKNFHLSVTAPDGILQTWSLGKHLSHKMCKHYTPHSLIISHGGLNCSFQRKRNFDSGPIFHLSVPYLLQSSKTLVAHVTFAGQGC